MAPTCGCFVLSLVGSEPNLVVVVLVVVKSITNGDEHFRSHSQFHQVEILYSHSTQKITVCVSIIVLVFVCQSIIYGAQYPPSTKRSVPVV